MDRELSSNRIQFLDRRPGKGALTTRVTSEGIEFRTGPQPLNLNGNYEVLVTLTHDDVEKLLKRYIGYVKGTARAAPSGFDKGEEAA